MRAIAQNGNHELTTSERIGVDTLNAADLQETFEKWTGSAFRISLGRSFLGSISLVRVETAYYPPRNRTINPQLSRVRPITPQPTKPQTANPFEITAVFLSFKRAASYLPQNVYTLDHPWLGTFDLLLVSCIRHSGPTSCTAVITRFRGQQPYVAQ
jgi:hypothetical protein